MKSQILKSRMYIECECFSPDHLLVFDLPDWPDNGNYVVDVSFASNTKHSLHTRIWYAIKYIFGKSFYSFDSVCISNRNIEQFEELIQVLKEQKEKLKGEKV